MHGVREKNVPSFRVAAFDLALKTHNWWLTIAQPRLEQFLSGLIQN
jgi:hypothetical protein